MRLPVPKKSLFKRVFRIARSGAFIGSILLALALWIYTSLNMSYTTFIKVPLRLFLPENRAIENPLPSLITIKVKSVGWYLFNLMYVNSSARCYVDLSDKNLSSDEYQVSRADLLKSIQNISNAEPLDVLPESLTLRLGKIGVYKVPVNVVSRVVVQDGFIIVGHPRVEPDSIILSGNEKMLQNIKSWNTQTFNLKRMKNSFSMKLALSDSLGNIVRKSDAHVNVYYDIQQTAEVTFHDVEVKVRGGVLPTTHSLRPRKITVTVRGGVEQLTTLSIDKVTSYIDYSDIANDTLGIIIPKINIPDGFILQGAYPRYLYHIIRTQSFD